jgi:predicted ATP-grasp superfamily ATP-dependent carboligase
LFRLESALAREGKLLIVGLDVVPIALSANKAGYEVYAVDYFGDTDLNGVVKRHISILHQAPGKKCGRLGIYFSPMALAEAAHRLAKEHSFDGVLLSSGLEDSQDALEALEEAAPIIGNPRSVIAAVRDRRRLFEVAKKVSVHCPETIIAEGALDAARAAEELGYPVIVKPTSGFGGVGVRVINDKEVLLNSIQCTERIVVQKYVRGLAASISIIANGNSASVLTFNEQLLGLPTLYAPEPFSYCGNVVPAQAPIEVIEKCRWLAQRLTAEFGLIGSNGIDIVVDPYGEVWVVEVNPRFQGTIECVERALGINLVEVHLAASLHGTIPSLFTARGCCVRLVLYSPSLCRVPDLSTFKEVRDIPVKGVLVEEGGPLCSILVCGENRGDALLKAFRLTGDVYSKLLLR